MRMRIIFPTITPSAWAEGGEHVWWAVCIKQNERTHATYRNVLVS